MPAMNLFATGAALAALALAPGAASPPAFDAGGRGIVPELAPNKILTIDGNPADWPTGANDTLEVAIAGGGGLTGTMRMVVRHPDNLMDDERLFLYVTVNDNSSNAAGSPDAQDRVVLLWDLYHSHTAANAGSWEASDDRGLKVTRGGQVERIYGPLNTPGSGGVVAMPGRLAVNTSSPTSWSFELELLPADLGLNSFNALTGAAAVALDVGGGGAGVWPATASDDPASWFNLVTRAPFDYVLLLDQSGSMSGAKWNAVRTAGNNFALMMSRLKDAPVNAEYAAMSPVVTGDRLGTATFTWKSGALFTEGPALAALPGAPPGNYTGTLTAPNGGTPILGGMERAITMLGGSAALNASPFGRKRYVMLMSDGMHNQPNGNPNVNTLSYQPGPPGSGSAMRVNPVAVGTDADVDTDLLNDLKDRYGNVSLHANITEPFFYNLAEPGAQLTANLTRYFAETILPLYNLNILDEGPAVSGFNVLAGERKLMLFAFWTNPGDAVPITVTKPQANGSPGGAVQAGIADPALGYSYLVLDTPAFGQYTNFTAPGAAYKLVLLDLRVEARFGIDAARHGTGGDILLRARLREDGQPLLGARVVAEEGFPEEGLGTLASTFQLPGCGRVEQPGLPKPVELGRAIFGDIRITPELLARYGYVMNPQAEFVGKYVDPADPTPYRFAWAQGYLAECAGGAPALKRGQETGLELFDDATNGDAVAGDGIYTRAVQNTQNEGSYVFRFLAEGKSSNGQTFRRLQDLAEYVFVDVDPAASPAGVRDWGTSGGVVLQEHCVTPRDRGGQYLGPSMARDVRFVNGGGGQFASEVLDYQNGVYCIFVRWNRERDERAPAVYPVVQGERLTPTTGKAVAPIREVSPTRELSPTRRPLPVRKTPTRPVRPRGPVADPHGGA